MDGEFGENIEVTRRGSKPKTKSSTSLTFDQAIDMGEYRPEFLSTFPKWSTFTKNVKWHYIRQALKNRRRFLELNYAETFNIIDFSKKPQLQAVLDNIQKELKKIQNDEEDLRVEYT